MTRKAFIQTLEVVDDDGLLWEWECEGYTYRAEYQSMRDSWVVLQVLLEGQGTSIIDEQECVSLAETLLFSIDRAKQRAKPSTAPAPADQ